MKTLIPVIFLLGLSCVDCFAQLLPDPPEGSMAGQAKKVQEEIGIPVLDPVLMGVKIAELRGLLWKRYKISHSKVGGYEAPPKEEFGLIFNRVYNKTE